MLQRVYWWVRPRLRWVNIGLATAAYLANLVVRQVFCQPVAWATAVLVVAMGAFLAWPWLAAARPVRYAALWLHGVAMVVCAYCVWFMSWEIYLISLPTFFLLLPLLAWVPILFAVQILARAGRSQLPGARLVFSVGVLSFVPLLAWGEWQYRDVLAAVRTLPATRLNRTEALAAVLPPSYLTERLVGIGFRYHLLAEYIYDGWRPPLHDPLVNVLVRWHGYPISFRSLNEQVGVYRLLFPGRPLKADCLCAYTDDGRSYRQWRPGLDDWSPAGAALPPRR